MIPPARLGQVDGFVPRPPLGHKLGSYPEGPSYRDALQGHVPPFPVKKECDSLHQDPAVRENRAGWNLGDLKEKTQSHIIIKQKVTYLKFFTARS